MTYISGTAFSLPINPYCRNRLKPMNTMGSIFLAGGLNPAQVKPRYTNPEIGTPTPQGLISLADIFSKYMVVRLWVILDFPQVGQ